MGVVQGLSGRHPHWLEEVLGWLNRASLGSGGGALPVPCDFSKLSVEHIFLRRAWEQVRDPIPP